MIVIEPVRRLMVNLHLKQVRLIEILKYSKKKKREQRYKRSKFNTKVLTQKHAFYETSLKHLKSTFSCF